MSDPDPPGGPGEEGPDALNHALTGSLFGDASAAGAGPGAYQVLARKHRPRTFDDLVGQAAMVRTLTNAFRTGRIAHAFMLTGVRGVGKTTTARLLARALNYETEAVDAPSMALDPPGRHCEAIMASRHPDVLELDAASRTGVSDMRELLDGVRYAPVMARFKVYIIDEVHMLSTAAFNALLKTLEEPPAHVKFIFATTEIRRVPVTVLSRCQRFNLQRFTTETLARHLAGVCRKENAEVDPEALALIARAAEGSARDGLSILDQAIVQRTGARIGLDDVREMLGLADRSRVIDLMDRVLDGDHRAALAETQALVEAGADGPTLIKDVMDVVVEASRAAAMADAYRFAGPADWGGRYAQMSARASPAQWSRMWRVLLEGFSDTARAPDPAVAAEMVMLRLTAVAALPPPEAAGAWMRGERGRADGPGGGPGGGGAGEGGAREGGPGGMMSAETAGVCAGAVSGGTYGAPGSGPGGGPGAGGGASRAMGGRGAWTPAPAEAADGVAAGAAPLHSLTDILDELEARRQFDLLYEVTNFVRPSEVRFGVFTYAAAPGAPRDLLTRLKAWLEDATDVEWRVELGGAGGDSVAEVRRRTDAERKAAIETDPRVAEALALFPGARIVGVGGEAPVPRREGVVVHVDFDARRKLAGADDAGAAHEAPEAGPAAPGVFTENPDEEDDEA